MHLPSMGAKSAQQQLVQYGLHTTTPHTQQQYYASEMIINHRNTVTTVGLRDVEGESDA